MKSAQSQTAQSLPKESATENGLDSKTDVLFASEDKIGSDLDEVVLLFFESDPFKWLGRLELDWVGLDSGGVLFLNFAAHAESKNSLIFQKGESQDSFCAVAEMQIAPIAGTPNFLLAFEKAPKYEALFAKQSYGDGLEIESVILIQRNRKINKCLPIRLFSFFLESSKK